MPLSFFVFVQQVLRTPPLAVSVFLILAVLLVNGWTDAPNAIASTVVTGALPFPKAVMLAALCNFLGVLCVASVNASVAETIYSIASFDASPAAALTALCAAMTAVVLWACFAWLFGIPTSESHALVAGLSGAAVALEGNFSCIHWDAWVKVIWGLVLSSLLGFGLGRLFAFLLFELPLSPSLCKGLQIPGAAGSAFFHGAQDGQKFIGIFLLGTALAQGRWDAQTFCIPLWLLVLCAGVMALGTRIGGRRIIEHIGNEMVQIGPKEGLAADLGGIICLSLATVLGFPVSTTHTRTAALWGAGTLKGAPVSRPAAQQILMTWLLTFPGCMVIGFVTARLYFLFFL